jgi:hypothetical protein
MGSTNGTITNINTTLSNISFSKESMSYLESLQSKSINVYPNPASGKFYCVFNSDRVMDANLVITDAYSGIKLFTKTISIEKGENKIPLDISSSYQTASGGICVISIKNSETTYSSKKLIIKPN